MKFFKILKKLKITGLVCMLMLFQVSCIKVCADDNILLDKGNIIIEKLKSDFLKKGEKNFCIRYKHNPNKFIIGKRCLENEHRPTINTKFTYFDDNSRINRFKIDFGSLTFNIEKDCKSEEYNITGIRGEKFLDEENKWKLCHGTISEGEKSFLILCLETNKYFINIITSPEFNKLIGDDNHILQLMKHDLKLGNDYIKKMGFQRAQNNQVKNNCGENCTAIVPFSYFENKKI